MIGTFEQVYMDICIVQNEAHEGVSRSWEMWHCQWIFCVYLYIFPLLKKLSHIYDEEREIDVNASWQVTTHQELDEVSMLSFAGNLTPFSDFNQSPRNMYQCQVLF